MKRQLIVILCILFIFSLTACKPESSSEHVVIPLTAQIETLDFSDRFSAEELEEFEIYTTDFSCYLIEKTLTKDIDTTAFIDRNEAVIEKIAQLGIEIEIPFQYILADEDYNLTLKNTRNMTLIHPKDYVTVNSALECLLLIKPEYPRWFLIGISCKYLEETFLPEVDMQTIDSHMLALNDLYFFQPHMQDEDYVVARAVATNFIDFVEKTYGQNVLITAINHTDSIEEINGQPIAAIRDSWITENQLAVDTIPVYDPIQCSSNWQLSRDVKAQTFQFSSELIDIEIAPETYSSPDFIGQLLARAKESKEIIRRYMESYKKQQYLQQDKIILKLDAAESSNYYVVGTNIIVLVTAPSDIDPEKYNLFDIPLAHEMTHLYTAHNASFQLDPLESQLYDIHTEGLAEYVAHFIDENEAQNVQQFFDDNFDSDSISDLWQAAGEKMGYEKGLPVDLKAYTTVLAQMTLTDRQYLAQSALRQKPNPEGVYPYNYEQSSSFVAFLIDTYGKDRFFKVFDLEHSYKEIYGKPFEEMRLEWLVFLDIKPEDVVKVEDTE